MSPKNCKNSNSKSRDEVISTLHKFGLFDRGEMACLRESEEIQRLNWFLSNGKIEPYEAPDAYVKIDNQILMIEHFAIDGFGSYRKGGSRLQYHEKAVECEFNEKPVSESGVHLTTQIGVPNSYEEFINNCKGKFDHHYSRIPCYKEHLISGGIASEKTEFTVCFLMDDVSPLGTLTHDGEKLRPVCLAQSKEFLEYFQNKPDVDWIISAVVCIPENGYFPYFFSQKDVDHCLDNALDYANYQFLSSESTIETRFKAVIPKKELVELGSILSIEKGKKTVSQFDSPAEGLLPYVDIETFETGKIKQYTDGVKCTPCDDGDILIVCDGSRSGLVGRAVKGYVGSTLAKISAQGLNSDYLFHFIQGKYALLNTRKKGTGTPHLNQDLLKQQKLIVPGSDEQERIVFKIEELFSQLDAGVETLKKTKEQLAVYRQAVYSEPFSDLTTMRKITDFFDISSGVTKNSNRANFPIKLPYLRVANVYYNFLDLTEIKEIGIQESEIDEKLLKKDDLLFVEGNGSKSQIGRVAIWDGSITPCIHQNHIIKGRPNGAMIPQYALYYLISGFGRKQVLQVASSTSGLYTLSVGKIKNLQIPYCDISAQEDIVNCIEERLSVCDSIEATVDAALQQAEAMRQSILKNAFEGRL